MNSLDSIMGMIATEATEGAEQTMVMERRMKRFIVSSEDAALCMMGKARLLLPKGSTVVAVQPDVGYYPIGMALIVSNDAFDIVPMDCEVPIAYPSIATAEPL